MTWIVVLLLVVQIAIAAAALWAMDRVERWCGDLISPPDGGPLRRHSIGALAPEGHTWSPPYSHGDLTERFPLGIPWTALTRDEGPPSHAGPDGGTGWMSRGSGVTPGPLGAVVPAARRDPLAAYRRAFECDVAPSNSETRVAPNAHEPAAVGPTVARPTAARPAATLDPRMRSRLEFARWLVERGRLSEEL